LTTQNQSTTKKEKKKVWVFAFEYAGIAKVGGLGEVSANQTRSLAGDPDLDVQVFMPCYGRHLELKEKMNLTPLKDLDGHRLVLRGHFDPAYFGLYTSDLVDVGSFSKFQTFVDVGYFEIEVWQGILDGAVINLLVGVNSVAERVLNDRDVYGYTTLNTKLGLFSQAMREFIRFCIYQMPAKIPELIHFHDHHPLAAFLCCRQELNLIGKDVRSIITMHLLTWPRREIEFYWKAGVNNEPMLINLGGYKEYKRLREIFDLCKGIESESPTLEKMGCVIADKVIAVSENFMWSDIIPNCGGELIRAKSDFIWNGCDWDYSKNVKSVLEKNKIHFPNSVPEHTFSWDLRRIFLTKILGDLPANEPKFENDDIKNVVSSEFNRSPYRSDCKVDAFDSDGPLVLITGRVSPQKGIETIFAALPYVIEKIPNVKFLFLLMPIPYTLGDLRNYMHMARLYPNNCRMIFGLAGSIYQLAYLASDVYCCPSRWEPFGITALEGMASKVPVVATYVGGLMESVLHLESYPEIGTGLLCPNNDSDALKYALVSLLSTMKIAETKAKNSNISSDQVRPILNNIVHSNLKAQVEKNLLFGQQIRENAYRRIENMFRWKGVSNKLKDLYLGIH